MTDSEVMVSRTGAIRVFIQLMSSVLLAITIGAAPQQQAPRDAPATSAGGAIIRGRVTSGASGQPLHRVRLTLNTQLPNPPSAVTDTRGIFEITGVPAGSYSLTATRAGYLTAQYGQRHPREAGRTIDVKAGEAVEGIDLALVREIVLTQKVGRVSGSVTDDNGKPTAAATVVVFADDDALWIPGSRFVRTTRPNREGVFSMAGLPAGTYRAIAREYIEDGQWEDRAFLDAARDTAVKFILSEGSAELLTLTVPKKVEFYR